MECTIRSWKESFVFYRLSTIAASAATTTKVALTVAEPELAPTVAATPICTSLVRTSVIDERGVARGEQNEGVRTEATHSERLVHLSQTSRTNTRAVVHAA